MAAFSKLRQNLPHAGLEPGATTDVETGMDSSRSGLLSTLIMTIPLIVVPAIALLRPAIQNAGISTSPLSASDDDDLFAEFGFDDFQPPSADFREPGPRKSAEPLTRSDSREQNGTADAADYADWIGELLPGGTAAAAADRRQPDTDYFPGDPFSELPESLPDVRAATLPESRSPADAVDSATTESTALRQVTELGATRTLWFTPGNHAQYGFVAFVAGRAPQIQYRFEAIGDSRIAAISQVLAQIKAWRAIPVEAPR